MGVDPTHFGVVVIFNLMIGIMHRAHRHRPVRPHRHFQGFRTASSRAPASPFIFCLLIVLIVITLVPSIAMWLPDTLMPIPRRSRSQAP